MSHAFSGACLSWPAMILLSLGKMHGKGILSAELVMPGSQFLPYCWGQEVVFLRSFAIALRASGRQSQSYPKKNAVM